MYFEGWDMDIKSYKRFYLILIISLLSFIGSSSCWAVIILDSTFKKYGFKPAEKLAKSPQFASLIYLYSSDSCGSGSWIGNYQGHGYVLTAGHMFPSGSKPTDYTYKTIDGTVYHGDAVFLHPLWNENTDDRTGYDFAIVRLVEPVDNVETQPALYKGDDEEGKMLTFIGYGYRGYGSKGQDTSMDTDDKPAAAEGLIESVVEAKKPVPKKGDAGNYFGIWLPKENGSIDNPFDKDGAAKPASPLVGLLGSGDSGGPAWIETSNGWVIAGINSNGANNAAYGDQSWFPRVSSVKEWIKKVVPSALFID